MMEPENRDGSGATEIEDLARRFHDLWREQLTAMAADPEFLDMMGKWMGATGGAGPFGLAPGLPGTAPMGGGTAAFLPFDPAGWLAALGSVAARRGTNQTDEQIAAGRRRPAEAGPAAASAPSGAGRMAGDELERRIADLERRLERLEAALGEAGKRAAGGNRTRRS